MIHTTAQEIGAIIDQIEPELYNFAQLIEDKDFVIIADTIASVSVTLSACSYLGYDKDDNKDLLHSAYNELIAWAILGKAMLERTEK